MGRDMMRLRRGILLNTPHEEQASGAVASFATDIGKLKECVVGIEPVQDLNGYGSPWPAGGGVNLLDPTQVTKYGTGAYGLTTSWDATTGAVTLSGTWTGSSSGGAWRLLNVPSSVRGYNVIGFSNSNNFSKFRWQADADMIVVEAKNMVKDQSYTIVAYPIVYSGTAPTSWTPYENICPISGWSEANVYDDPKYDRTVWWNQAFLPASDWKAHSVQTRFSVSDGVITATMVSGSPSVYAPAIEIEGGTVVTSIANHKYYFACKFNPAADGYPYLRNSTAFGTAAVFGTKTTRAGEWGSYENIVSAPATGGPAWYLGNGGNTSQIQIGDSFSIKDLMCIDLTAIFGAGNEPSTVDEFKALFPNDYYAYNAGEETLVSAVNGEPYQAVTIDLNGTRYGGRVSLNTGVMTVCKTYALLNDPDKWAEYSSATGNFRYSDSFSDRKKYNNSYTGLTCSYMQVNNNQSRKTARWVGATSNIFGLATLDISSLTLAKVKADAEAGKIEIVYELNTPFTVQLTPAQLKALKGQNNIFADCGDVAVKYWKH